MAQNWNNVLSYIKANLGSKLNNLEIEDQEFVVYFKEHTMPEFSTIEPAKAWAVLTPANLRQQYHKGGILYEFKLEKDNVILDVHEIYLGNYIGQLSEFGSYFFDPTDVVMSNTLSDILSFLRPVPVFQFIRPNKLLLSERIPEELAIIEINVEHNIPDTIPSDLYRSLFLKMCLCDGIQMVLANRMKYSNLTSPFGEINLNIDYLQNKLETLRTEITEANDWVPHRELLYIV